MKFESNWKYKTLENLEKDFWGEPQYSSHLVTTCHQLRKKQLKDFEVEDLRIMIGQNIGLNYLIPIALEVLQSNILAEGDFYEGDLLKNVLTSETEYWKREKDNWETMCNIFLHNISELETFDTTKQIRNGWFESFQKFEKLSN